MAVSEKIRETLTEVFNDILYDDMALGEKFQESNPNACKTIVKEVMDEEGFESHITPDMVGYSIIITSRKEGDTYADDFMDAYQIEDAETLDSYDKETFTDFILNDTSDLEFTVELDATADVMKEEVPSEEYLAEQMASVYNPDTIDEIITNEGHQHLEDIVRQRATEEGISSDVPLSDIEYNLTDITLKETYSGLASRYLESIEVYGSVSAFVSELHETLLNDDYIDYDVTITSDPEDFESDEY